MKRDTWCVGLAVLMLALTGCTPREVTEAQLGEPASQPAPEPVEAGPIVPDLSDCILFELSPAPVNGVSSAEFGEEARDALERILPGRVFYERFLGVPHAFRTPGLVDVAIAPGQARSLTYSARVSGAAEEVRTVRVPGFFPPVDDGRLPEEPGEALVLGLGITWPQRPDDPTDSAPLEGRPRRVGEVFRPYLADEYDTTIVGRTHALRPMWETIWVTDIPEGSYDSHLHWDERASAIMEDIDNYLALREELTASAVQWAATRVRDGVADPEWEHAREPRIRLRGELNAGTVSTDRDFPLLQHGHNADFHIRPEREGGLRVSFEVPMDSGPVAVEDLEITIGGAVYEPAFVEGNAEGPVTDAYQPRVQYTAHLDVEVAPGRHVAHARIGGRLEGACILKTEPRR